MDATNHILKWNESDSCENIFSPLCKKLKDWGSVGVTDDVKGNELAQKERTTGLEKKEKEKKKYVYICTQDN